LADNRLVYVNLVNRETEEFNPPMYFEINSLVVHPQFNLFVAVCSNGVALFDLQQKRLPHEFELSSRERVTCAIFSPNGSKLAVCSTVIDIFAFDLSKWKVKPAVSREINQQVTAIAWINTDTLLAVAYVQHGHGCLVVVDSLTKYHTPIDLKKEWGVVTGIGVEPRRGKLVFGTSGGVTVVIDTMKSCEVSHVYEHGRAVTAMACLYQLFVVATEAGTILAFSTSDNGRWEKLRCGARVAAVAVVDDLIAATSENRLFLWRVKEQTNYRV
jgi:WD40 repeat protein